MQRPRPPIDLLSPLRYPEAFSPAPELAEWIRAAYIEPGGALYNPEHQHLQQAVIGCLWTNVPNVKQGNQIAATCEIPKPTQGSKWQKARLILKLQEWFGEIPDFLLTFDSVLCGSAPDKPFCSTVDHELYHAAQACDDYGSPRFRKDDGRPVFTVKGHDVEEHLGVIRRWGPQGVLNPNVREMMELAARMPTVPDSGIVLACGTCGGRFNRV